MEDRKTILTSKTFWLGIASAIAPLFPQLKPIIEENIDAALAIIGALIIAVRFVTSKPVSIVKPKEE